MSRLARRRSSRGQSLVEFALIIPVLLLIMMALFDIGRVVIAYTAITNSAREGARLAIVNQSQSKIEERVLGQTAIANPTIDLEFYETGPNPDAVDNDECDPLEAGCIAWVEVTTTIDVITPIIGALIGPIDLTAESQMAVELVCPSSTIAQWSDANNCPKQP